MTTESNPDADVIVVGAGMAGSTAAYVLARQGFSVILIDRAAQFPRVFRAEKLEADQVELLKKFELLEQRRPHAPPIGDNIIFKDGRCKTVDTVEQYGMRYHDTVNQIRRHSSDLVDFRVHRVEDLPASEATNVDVQRVVLRGGDVLTARLVVLACGYQAKLVSQVGAVYEESPDLTSYSFGFDIRKTNGEPFGFRAFNYHFDRGKGELDYLTLFPIGDVTRANLFTQFSPSDPRAKRLRTEAYEALTSLFPQLIEQIGDFEISSDVESFVTSFYRVRPPNRARVVLIGDSFQSVSPTTGTGLSKVLNDVDVLCNRYIPDWLSKKTISIEDVRGYYEDTQKVNADKHSHGAWKWYRDSQKRNSIRGKIKMTFVRLIRPLARLCMGRSWSDS